MGVSLSWVFLKSVDRKLLLSEFGLRQCSKAELADGYKQVVSCHSLPHDSHLLVANKKVGFPPERAIRLLSRAGQVFTGLIEERIMASNVVSWQRGEISWAVYCNRTSGDSRLEVFGELPPILSCIVEQGLQLCETKTEDDSDALYFQIPVDIASKVTEYDFDSPDNSIETDLYLLTCEATDENNWFLELMDESLKLVGFFPDYSSQETRSSGTFVFGAKEDFCHLNMHAFGAEQIVCIPTVSFYSKPIRDLIDSIYVNETEPYSTVSGSLSFGLKSAVDTNATEYIFSSSELVSCQQSVQNICTDLKNRIVPQFQRYCSGALSTQDLEMLKLAYHAQYHLIGSLIVGERVDEAISLSSWFIDSGILEGSSIEIYKDFVSRVISSYGS